MRVECAWCAREGKPAFLRTVEPLESEDVSHGICDDHMRVMLHEVELHFRSREGLELEAEVWLEALNCLNHNTSWSPEHPENVDAFLARVREWLQGRIAEFKQAIQERARERRSHSDQGEPRPSSVDRMEPSLSDDAGGTSDTGAG